MATVAAVRRVPWLLSALVIVIGVGLVHPIPQAGIADTQVFGKGRDRFIALTGQLDGTLPELDRVRCRHEAHLPS
jgi:hypothetical protein